MASRHGGVLGDYQSPAARQHQKVTLESPLRILLLEDNASDAELIRELLEADHFVCQVSRVQTRVEFLTALENDEVDLILADYRLPSFDGLSALKLTLSARPDLPFIFVSGSLGEEVAIETLKIGATDYVLKTGLSRLVPAVRRALREAEEVAERKKAEEALRRSERELRQVIETIPTMVWSALPDGSNALMNRRWKEFTDSSAAGQGWQAAVHPEDLKRHIEAFRACAAAGLPFEDEVRFRRADGEYRWFLVQGMPVQDEQGNILKWYGIVTDIEDRKRAEEALRRSESYLAQAQSLAHIGSWAWEVPGMNSLYMSWEWYRVCGFDPKDGVPTWEQRLQNVHPDDRGRYQATVNRAIAEKSGYDVEFRIVPPHSPIRFIRSVGQPVMSPSGELLQFVGVAMDVTESRIAEEERERLRQELANLAHLNRVSTIGELTASLAHEIKQPIGAAVTNAEACLRFLDRERPDVPEAREAALEMVRDARRAADIIDRVRSLYRKGSSRQEMVDVNDVIREMVVMLRDEANRHSVTMHPGLGEGLPGVMADRVQLQQALMNLMLNGIEAMRDMGGELRIESQLAEDGQVLISVTDAGVGLPTGKADQIFDAFFTTKPQGTGLGLAITRSIIESHGGRVWATANSGRGATFQFTLPQQSAAHA